jgi:phytol kinase
MIAVLHLALADGAAAVVGKLLGKKYYYLFGASKTYIGSSAFFGTSLMILLSFLVVTGAVSPINVAMIVAGAAILTLVEGSVGIGLDNLAVPLTAAVITEFLILNV